MVGWLLGPPFFRNLQRIVPSDTALKLQGELREGSPSGAKKTCPKYPNSGSTQKYASRRWQE